MVQLYHSFVSLLGPLRRRLMSIWKYQNVYKLPSRRGAPEGVQMRLFTLGDQERLCFLRISDMKTPYKLTKINLIIK